MEHAAHTPHSDDTLAGAGLCFPYASAGTSANLPICIDAPANAFYTHTIWNVLPTEVKTLCFELLVVKVLNKISKLLAC